MAPTRPANTTVSVMSPLLTMPLAIVAATERESSAPTKLRAPASRTATRGRSAPVAIEVAIAFAVSWNPLVKSNPSAETTTIVSSTSLASMGKGRSSPAVGAARAAQLTVHPGDSECHPDDVRANESLQVGACLADRASLSRVQVQETHVQTERILTVPNVLSVPATAGCPGLPVAHPRARGGRLGRRPPDGQRVHRLPRRLPRPALAPDLPARASCSTRSPTGSTSSPP